MSDTIESKIKLSALRKIVIDNQAEFLCHAVVHSIGKKWEYYTCDEDVLFQEIKRVIGPHFVNNRKFLFLPDWLKNLPGHLRAGCKGDRIKFRTKFLTWVINKFGDQEIRVVCLKRNRGQY